MKAKSFQEWIFKRFKRTIFAVFIVSFTILFFATTYFGLLDRVNSLVDSSRAFAAGQILNLQVYDFSRLNFDIETFTKGKPFEFIRVQDANGITIGKWNENEFDLESNGSTLSAFKWFLDRNHTKLGLSQGFNRIIVRTDIVDSKNEVLGSLEIFLPLYTFLRNFIILGGVFVGLVYLIYYVLKMFLSQIARVASEPIAEIAGILESAGTTRELEKINVESNIFEVNLLVDRFRDLSRRLSEKEAEQLKLERLDAIAGLSAQVAHDIRSPLAALEIMIADSPSVPQSNRMMIKSAVGRIRDITNQLSAKNQQFSKIPGGKTDGEATSHLLSPLIESLVTEKRIQYRSKLRIKIEANLGASSYGLFVNTPSAEFTCVLSNLIDNAVDAIGDQGVVTVTLEAQGKNIEVRIHDTGKGIPPEVLPTLMQKGVTYEKDGGSGLGLFHARTSAEIWGGGLSLQSQPGTGTTVLLTLPKCDTPPWFLKKLLLCKDSAVVILDDDESIHQLWKNRFERLALNDKGVQIFHFSTPEAIKQWNLISKPAALHIIYLVDYELLGQEQTGLDVIEELQIQGNSVLVTSHYEEGQIRSRCSKLGLRLLPKAMMGFVPIIFEESRTHFDAVFIDDDELMRTVWQNSAKNAGIQLKAFRSAEEFFRVAQSLGRETKVYVDAHLADGVRGETVSQEISKMGFSTVYLASSYDLAYFPSMPWLAGIRDKNPPWLN